ncbi:MAG: penicillin-binding transpeptidase domain-containing protein, partial [Hyphomicrobium sp.]
DVGRGRSIAVARRLGIKSELREEPSLALGTSEVSLLEMTGAYGVFANGGTEVEPHAIRRVRMSSGRVLFAREAASTHQAVDPLHVGELNVMLNSALTSGTGRRAAIANHQAAGKTGTSQDFRDAWFIGYTAHLTAGVWIGNDNGKPMLRAVGGGLPADIWRELMTAAHAGKAPLSLPGMAWEEQPRVVAPEPAHAREERQVSKMEARPPLKRQPKTADAETQLSRAPQSENKAAIKPAPPLAIDHPDAPVNEDLIAKAIAEHEGADAAPQVAEEVSQPRERPKGIMSLGGWW